MKNPCIFFDRDGIVNESPGLGYVERWEDFHLQPGFVGALKKVVEKGYHAVIITNQQGVAKGLYTEEVLAAIHGNMRAQLRSHGADVLDVFYCPHFEVDECDCRKPKAGMFHQAAEKYNVDLSESWMIGDSESDIEAGHSAGCKTIRVGPLEEKTKADFHVQHIDEVAGVLEKELKACVQ